MQIKTAMILAGGRGTRFKEETELIPKPMIMANGRPLIEYIMMTYANYDVKNFIVLAGYKHEVIFNYFEKKSIEFDVDGNFIVENNLRINVLNTGLNTETGGRIKQGIKYLDEEHFYLTYGDGISDININDLTNFHFSQNTLGTVTAVRPPARFGSLAIENNLVKNFAEKDNAKEGYINGGYFVLNKSIDNYIFDNDVFEQRPLKKLSNNKLLSAFKHNGYWRPVDTIRELELLESELDDGKISFK